MRRREALKSVALILGTTIVGAEAFLTGCVNSTSDKILSSADLELLNEIAEVLLPKTDTPGAKDANVAQFMNVIVTDFYSAEEQQTFKRGISTIQKLVYEKYESDYFGLTQNQKDEFISLLEKDMTSFYSSAKQVDHYFMMIRQLTIWAYLSSEIVVKSAFIHLPVPGKYIGEIDYKPGDKVVYEDIHRGTANFYAKRGFKGI